jgi:hypothetical protein
MASSRPAAEMSYGVRSTGSGGGGGGWNARGRTTLPPPEPSRCTTTLRRVLARARGIADAKTGAGPIECPLPVPPRALSSVGRALPLQGNGRRFESCSAHRPRRSRTGASLVSGVSWWALCALCLASGGRSDATEALPPVTCPEPSKRFESCPLRSTVRAVLERVRL